MKLWGCVFAGLAAVATASPTSINDLINYVNKQDPAFTWWQNKNHTLETDLFTIYSINVTSGTWLTPDVFVPAGGTGYVWSHQVMCVYPKAKLHTETIAGIYITGGGNGDSWPGLDDEDVLVATALAMESKSVVCSMFQVPNQDIQFADDPDHKRRGEDALVAYSWLRFINAGYNSAAAENIVNLPMARGASAAMTAVTQFFAQEKKINLQKYLIAGASKRGWTTWLIGAADGALPAAQQRILGIAPIVMDMLNFYKNVPHMPMAYGGWTFAFTDYCQANITKYINTPQLAALSRVVDPLEYVDQLTMPKLVIDATGDEFFMPDDDYMWWGQLKGETYRVMAQNAEHSEATGIFELLNSIHGYYASIIEKAARPTLTWDFQPSNGTITATTNTKPNEILLWHATSNTVEVTDGRRDFRLVCAITEENPCKFIPIDLFGHNCLNPIIWTSEKVTPTQVGSNWVASAYKAPPSTGYIGYFLQFKWPGPPSKVDSKYNEFVFTTQQAILPNTYPFPQGCEGFIGGCANCSGYYV